MTRCGLHCAPSAHKTLGSFPAGSVRFSIGWANTEADIDSALAAVAAIRERQFHLKKYFESTQNIC